MSSQQCKLTYRLLQVTSRFVILVTMVLAVAMSGGEKGRQLTKQEVTILNKPSVYAVGTTLVHLALR